MRDGKGEKTATEAGRVRERDALLRFCLGWAFAVMNTETSRGVNGSRMQKMGGNRGVPLFSLAHWQPCAIKRSDMFPRRVVWWKNYKSTTMLVPLIS
jgi:hypothetical protein